VYIICDVDGPVHRVFVTGSYDGWENTICNCWGLNSSIYKM